jgi:tRNA pseudouridine38-40 synthase
MRYRATVAYDGTLYHGFQRQVASQTTIQGELERALLEVGGVAVAVTGAGRTDRGVHARGQVISFELQWRHGSTTLKRAINANLPLDIVLVDVAETDADFHPRYDARQRVYEYYIYNQPTRDPLVRLYSWHVRERLQLLPMQEAASELVGSHDFATFGQPPQGDNTIRQVYGAEWRRQDDTLVFRIEGNAFLYRMVRSIVGTLTQVGAGNWSAAEFVEAFRAADRSRAAASAPPQGLFLVSVSYEN